MLSIASAAAAFPGFVRWAYGGEPNLGHHHGDSPTVTPRSNTYKPVFLDNNQFGLLETLTDLIIPRDAEAGALDAGAAEFIDFYMSHEGELAYRFRTALTAIEADGVRQTGRKFLECDRATQEKLLRPLAYRAEWRPGEEDLQEYFHLVRRFTVIGYYTSRAGMEALGSPGLRIYDAMPGCTHEDAEHLELTKGS